jgi:hypothetical protein
MWEKKQRLRAEWDDKPNSQSGATVGHWAIITSLRDNSQNWIAPPWWGRNWPAKVAAVGQWSCHWAKTTTDLTTLHELGVSYLKFQLQPAQWSEGTKYCAQGNHLMRPFQGSCLKWTAHKTKEGRTKKKKRTKPSSHLYPKLSDKRGSTFPQKAQNTKHQ